MHFLRSVLSDVNWRPAHYVSPQGLNAAFGARCFLSSQHCSQRSSSEGWLNAPFGARCILSPEVLCAGGCAGIRVLMQLLVLGAF